MTGDFIEEILAEAEQVELQQRAGYYDLVLAEIRDIEQGRADRKNNLLKNAPHTAAVIGVDAWDRPYSRERAAFPTEWTRERKFWPPAAAGPGNQD